MGDNRPTNGVVTVTLTKVEKKGSEADWSDATDITAVPAEMKKIQGNYHLTVEADGYARIHPFTASTTSVVGVDVFDATEDCDLYYKITNAGAIVYYGADATFTSTADMKVRYSVAAKEESDTEDASDHTGDLVQAKEIEFAD